MAQAAACPIGFHSLAKAPDPDAAPLDDSALAELRTWQTSPGGLAAAQIFSLSSTIADLNALAASPLGLSLLAAELPDLELIQTEIARLISEVYAAREIVA
jgi:hypothetical protein